MAIKFREILFTTFCAASAAMLLIFIPLAILLSPSAGYASLGYHPYLFQLLLYGLFYPDSPGNGRIWPGQVLTEAKQETPPIKTARP